VISFLLNGRAYETERVTVTYREIARATMTARPTVTYRVGEEAGEMVEGDAIGVSPALVITATERTT
jgi:phosphosulfolactate phosphohydrolase-like enzyme